MRLTISDLAHGDRNDRGHHLRLAIVEDSHDGGVDHRGANHISVTIADLAGTLAARQGKDSDLVALRSPVTVVDVAKCSRVAAVEGGGATKSDVTGVRADREAGSNERAGLRRVVELELVV